MSKFINKISFFTEEDLADIANTPLEFLRALNGLCVFDIAGKDTSRTRVVTTLIHGNEPSGFIAIHRWLKQKIKPAVNVRFIICNVEAAQLSPEFSHRYLHFGQDLNRFFASEEDKSAIAKRARKIAKSVSEVKPEAVIDLHNTSGISPAFGVAIDGGEQALDLISLFTNKVILTGLRVGAIMEQNFAAPIVTIECGGAGQIESHQLAYLGLMTYVCDVNIFDRHASSVDIHEHPCRVELLPHCTVAFGHDHLPTADVTLRADTEQLNNQLTPSGEFLGWYEGETETLPFTAKNEQGVEQSTRMFRVQNGRIFTKQSLQIFMATTDPDIASKDCLFYATQEEEVGS